MPLEPDPYLVLGLTRGATLAEVKRAYRRLAKANHPDAAGPAALARFLAIQAAYERLAGPSAGAKAAGRSAPTVRQRPSAADPDRTEATRRAYRARATQGRGDADQGAKARPGRARTARPDSARGTDPDPSNGDEPRARGARGKATLGSTSYDGADAGPFEPDWGGASWYGTTSGTYWTINPKEYADPRKHGPEYQARARRAAGAHDVPSGAGGESGPDHVVPPTHTTSSWWDSTAGPEETAGSEEVARPDEAFSPPAEAAEAFAPPTSGRGAASGARDAAPDPTRAAIDLGRALTDPRSGGLRGRVVRGVLGWIPIALGIGWLVGELTGCGRFAATCDPAVTPLTAVGQAIVLVALVVVPEVAAIAAGAALVLLAAALGATLVLSATGTAADEGSRRAALGALLLVAWLGGLAIAVVRRFRSGPHSSRPVS
ncbi:MAG: J domain-containing protein [Chloroflexota bacterium]